MLQRIRLAMKNQSLLKLGNGGGPVEVDETFIGGKLKNMHKEKRVQHGNGPRAAKTVVMGMLDCQTRQIRAKVIPNVDRGTLQAEILNGIKQPSKLYTDSHHGYQGLNRWAFVHETVNHMEEYVRGEVHTQGIENFWSLLKRGLNGTYVAVEPFHLERYVDEQMFRFNNRKDKTDYDRFAQVLKQVSGKRLTYAEVTGKDSLPPF
jgi:transposase-like protein